MSENLIPTDIFSRRMRELTSNPGAVRSTSMVATADFYGNVETWVIDSFRVDGKEEVLLQRISKAEPLQLVLPPDVTEKMLRQRDANIARSRRRGARAAVATKRAAGIDPAAALRKHRSKR